jgi:hypothetical protein
MANGSATLTAGTKTLTAKKKNVKIPITLILTNGGTQPRNSLDAVVIKEYKEAMLGNDAIPAATFPPVEVIEDEHGNHWLVDGFHRLKASQDAGFTEITANLYDGTQRDAVLASVGANATHGLPRTNKDKEKAVLRLLEDEEWRKYSDRQIAQITNTSNTFVGSVRHKNGYGTEERITAKGEVMKTGNIGEGATGRTSPDVEAEAAAMLNGDSGTVANAGTEIVDPFGRAIPPRMGFIFDEKRTIEVLISGARQVKKHMTDQFERMNMSMNAAQFAGITRTEKALKEHIGNFIRTLRFEAMPYAVGPYCKGEEAECPACEGRGYLPEDEAKRSPEELIKHDETATELGYWNEETKKAAKGQPEPTTEDLKKEIRRLSKELKTKEAEIAKMEAKEEARKAKEEEKKAAAKAKGAGVDAASKALQNKAAKNGAEVTEGEAPTTETTETAPVEAQTETAATETTEAPAANGTPKAPKAPKGRKAAPETETTTGMGEVISGTAPAPIDDMEI